MFLRISSSVVHCSPCNRSSLKLAFFEMNWVVPLLSNSD